MSATQDPVKSNHTTAAKPSNRPGRAALALTAPLRLPARNSLVSDMAHLRCPFNHARCRAESVGGGDDDPATPRALWEFRAVGPDVGGVHVVIGDEARSVPTVISCNGVPNVGAVNRGSVGLAKDCDGRVVGEATYNLAGSRRKRAHIETGLSQRLVRLGGAGVGGVDAEGRQTDQRGRYDEKTREDASRCRRNPVIRLGPSFLIIIAFGSIPDGENGVTWEGRPLPLRMRFFMSFSFRVSI